MVFFVGHVPEGSSLISLAPEDAAHVSRVLRMRQGQAIIVFDSAENRLECVLEDIGKSHVTARILGREPRSNEPSVAVTVYAGLSKGDRFEYLIQKCVECGVRHIVPFVSRFCVAVPKAEDYDKKRERFERIALEAAKQSGRSRPPTVGNILPYGAVIQEAAQAELGLFLWEKENQMGLRQRLSAAQDAHSYAIVTGPEGGFAPEECDLARQAGLHGVSLGPRILRCETAPVAALCAIMYHTGNFDIGE